MAGYRFGWPNFFLRLGAALVLVLATYNPSGYSWVHWLQHSSNRLDPLLLLAAVLLVIGWVIFLRATARSLGLFGSLLVLALFGTLVWAMVYYGWLSLDDASTLSWVTLILLAVLLAVGISWSHIRRRLTGQVDVDEVDED